MSELPHLSKILDKDPLEMTALEFAVWLLSATDEDRAEEAAKMLFEYYVALEAFEEKLAMEFVNEKESR